MQINKISDMLEKKLDTKFDSIAGILNTIREDQAALMSRCNKLEKEIGNLKNQERFQTLCSRQSKD